MTEENNLPKFRVICRTVIEYWEDFDSEEKAKNKYEELTRGDCEALYSMEEQGGGIQDVELIKKV
jgi:hypothetical protein